LVNAAVLWICVVTLRMVPNRLNKEHEKILAKFTDGKFFFGSIK